MMKPITKLPWFQDPTGDCGPQYVGPADGVHFTTIAYKKRDAAYIVHACNAYPRLVEALIGSQMSNAAVDLLRELGELR